MLLPPEDFARKFSSLLESANVRQDDLISYFLDCKPAPFGMIASVQLNETGVERIAEKLSSEIEFLPSRTNPQQRGYGFITDVDNYTLEAFYYENFP